MIRDEQADADIEWTPYGKVSLVDRGTVDQKVYFGYGPDQNRVMKAVVDVSATDTIFSYYIRDAQGNVMALYERQEDTVVWREQYLYGSNRLGLMESDVRWYPGDGHIDSAYHVINPVLYEGCKRYEIANHLGNVMAVVSDRREAIDSTSNSEADYYEAVVLTANDYYPFGQEMPGRTYNIGDYRYGFNGKEKDQNDEWGDLTHYDYGFRIYNPAIGRFLSVDPLAASYPWNSTYAFAENRVIDGIDLEGGEFLGFGYLVDKLAEGATELGLTRTAGFIESYGHSLIVDPLYSADQVVQTVKDPNATKADVAKQFDPTGLSSIPDVVETGKKAIDGDERAQGQILGMLPGLYGGFKAGKAGFVETIATKRTNLATSFYKKVGGNLKELSGIDFESAVQTKTLKKGTVVQQWVREGGEVGSYFAYEGADAAKLGISTEGRVLKTFKLTEDVKVLQSKTKDIAGHKGGETQIYNPELKGKIQEVTQ